MKNLELLNLSQTIQSCFNFKGIKFAYAIAKNAKLIQREVEPLVDTIKSLQEQYAEKDADGKAVIVDNQYKMADLEKFSTEYQILMNIDVDITLHKVKQEDLPADISAAQILPIMEMIED